MQDLKTENILKVVYNHPTTKEEKQQALKEYVDLIWKINDLTKEVKELSIPRVSNSLKAYVKWQDTTDIDLGAYTNDEQMKLYIDSLL